MLSYVYKIADLKGCVSNGPFVALAVQPAFLFGGLQTHQQALAHFLQQRHLHSLHELLAIQPLADLDE